MKIEELFFNRVGRLRSGWRLAIFGLLLYVALAMLFSLLTATEAPFLLGNWGFVVQGFVLLVPATLLGWVCNKHLEDLPPRALGWAFQRGWLKDLLFGSLLGAVSLLLAVGIAALLGDLRFKLNAPVVFETVGRTLLTSLPIFVIAAAGEEAMFRGYGLQTMARARLSWVALIITSVIFSWGHLGNPHIAPGFTFATAVIFVNTAIAGVWLAIAYLKTRNLWFPLGIHWAWNWVMGAVLGVPVSGLSGSESPMPHPLWRSIDHGPAWLTGGDYGIEGGAACTIALIISTLFIWRTQFVRASPEMKAMTDHENPKIAQQPVAIFGSDGK